MASIFLPENLNLKFFGRQDSIGYDLHKIMQQQPQSMKFLFLCFVLIVSIALANSISKSFSEYKNDKTSMTRTQFIRMDSGNRVVATLAPPPLRQLVDVFRRLLPRYLDQKSLLDGDVLKKALRDNIGDITFLEAFEKTGRVINISVTPRYTNGSSERCVLVF